MKALRWLALAMLGSLLASANGIELTGKVVDANTGEPIARVHVTLRFQGPQPAQELTLLSDTDGVFTITDLPASGYQVSCSKAGYLTANQPVGGPGKINSPDGKNTSTIVVKMTSQAALEGTVVDDKDMPAENAMIQLVSQQVVNGRRQLVPSNSGTTDETGYFRLYGLPAGRYYISIGAKLTGARRAKPLSYPPLYYPAATEIAAAQPIDLKAGDEQQIKVRLPEPVPAFEVRGVVATDAPNVSIGLVRQGPSQMFQPFGGESKWDAPSRSFRISHVTPGTYLLTAMVAQDGKIGLQASTTVTVGNANVAGISLEPSGAALDGTVRMEGDTAQRAVVYVNLQSLQTGNGALVDADGKFHIPNISPDTYRIVPQIPNQQWCVRSILEGGREVRDGLTITAGVAPGPVEIVVTSHCGSVDVTLAPSDSPAPPNLVAFLLRKAGDEFVLERQGYQSARPSSGDSATHFTIQGVAPGDYTVYVWGQNAQMEYANAEYMRQFDGQAVTVSADSKASVTVDKIVSIPAKN